MSTFTLMAAASPAPVFQYTWTTAGSVPYINDPTNDNEYIEGSGDDNLVVFYLPNPPADFLSIDSVSLEIRYSVTGIVDDAFGFTFDWESGAGTIDYIPQQIVHAPADGNRVLSTKVLTPSLTADGLALGSDWSDTRWRVRPLFTAAMKDDGALFHISSIQMPVIYTASGGGGTTDHLFLGDKTVTGMKLGDTNVLKAYLGDVQVFPAS